MVRYLQSPTLTLQERLEAISDMNLLEGLDKLYMRILENVQEHLPQRQWVKVQKIFQWIAAAPYPLRTLELRIALAAQQSRAASKDDLIPDFEPSLVQICRALVEIKEDLTVYFIHLSVLKFLQIEHLECVLRMCRAARSSSTSVPRPFLQLLLVYDT
jgi:hypothetical protein